MATSYMWTIGRPSWTTVERVPTDARLVDCVRGVSLFELGGPTPFGYELPTRFAHCFVMGPCVYLHVAEDAEGPLTYAPTCAPVTVKLCGGVEPTDETSESISDADLD